MLHVTHRRSRLRAGAATLVLALVFTLGLAACATDGTIPGVPSSVALSSPGGDPRTAEHGYIPSGDGVSPFDEKLPAIARLEPKLRAAVQAATTAAHTDGITMVVTSGWRSAAYQQSLLDEATVTYGSLEEARRWVNTPELSTHVTGDGVDIGYTDADYWLLQHGATFGLCQIYSNEVWHFELAVEPGGTCPTPKSDASAG